MSKHLRRRKFVDRTVQGTLVAMMIRFWALSMVFAGGLTVAGWIFIAPGISGFIGPDSFMVRILPMFLVGCVAALLVLPVVALQLVRISHRFAGPILRFKRHLQDAADGGPLVPLHFRDGDFWPELAETYNDLIARIEAERSATARGQTPTNSVGIASSEKEDLKTEATVVMAVDSDALGTALPANV
ncbi:MAG: hypothetical protein ACR2NU_03505 [Aeoliella sp.]